MNLKDFLSNRDNPPELYWSLVLEPGWVQAGIWYIGDKVAEVISTSPPTPWEVETELVGATDTALSSAVQKLPEEYPEPSKTVFGVPSAWVTEGEITEEKIGIIKKLCADLSLTPVGFVVLPEAVAHLYKSEEGSPVSAIIMGLGKEALELSVFKMGNLAGSTTVARSVSLVDDVIEGLSRFESASPLPSRFIVFDGKGGELEEAKETLTQASWEGKVKFLHAPKVETLASDRKVLATSLAGANEIGDVSHINSKNEDLPVGALPEDHEIENVTAPEEGISPKDLGFAVGEDVSLKMPTEVKIPVAQPAAPPVMDSAMAAVPVPGRENYVQKTRNMMHGFSDKIFGRPKISGGKKPPGTFLGVSAAIVFLVFILAWWFLPKANIIIYVTPLSSQEEVNVVLSAGGVKDPENSVLAAEILTERVVGEKTGGVTGSKTVGDRAKGMVKIQNGTAFPINLPSGTVLLSSGNLKFNMDNSASVSAAISPSSPGTATVEVTAESIGAEYNLAKDEIFRVGNYPKAEVDGTSEEDFSGGSSRQIPAVDKNDTSGLLSQLTDELNASAKEKLSAKVTNGQILVGDLVSSEIISESFDRKIGDEADNLKLALTLEAKAVVVDKEELLEFARRKLENRVPDGFVLRDTQITFDFTFVDEEDGNFNYKVLIRANFLPQTDTEDIKKLIVGKTPNAAETYLARVPGFTRVAVVLKPRFPGFLGLIPRVKRNINVEIMAER
jgi:predicted nucleic acid-binding protein